MIFQKGGDCLTALYTILGIIAFFVIVFSIRVVLILDYENDVDLWVKWLFIKFRLLPFVSKKKPDTEEAKEAQAEPPATAPTEESPPSDEPAEPEQPPAETKPEQAAAPTEGDTKPPSKEKKPSFLKQLYEIHGFDGLLKMVQDAGNALKGFFGRVLSAFVIDELYLTASVSGGDAADTALKYGKICEKLFASLGAIVSTCKVKKYDVNVYPDFLGKGMHGKLHVKLSVRPIKLTNAAVALAFSLLFKVVLKILFKKQKSPKINKNVKGGASS